MKSKQPNFGSKSLSRLIGRIILSTMVITFVITALFIGFDGYHNEFLIRVILPAIPYVISACLGAYLLIKRGLERKK